MNEGTIATGERMDVQAIGCWAEANVDGFRGPFTMMKFAGGQSNPTYLIEAASSSYILRRQPFGPLLPSAHAVDREYRLISTLHPLGFPVPRPYGLCTDPSVIGAMFYIMEYVLGRNFTEGAPSSLCPADRRAAYYAMVDTLAALHRIDPQPVGLADFGRPGNYFERQISRWTKQYRATATDTINEMEQLIEWLPRRAPTQSGTALIHGDYRIDNVIFAPDRAEIIGVIDWELSTLGDPLADFSYFALNWVGPAIGKSKVVALDLVALGIPTLEEIIERYCAAVGWKSMPDLDWYFAYNCFRLACILQGIRKRAMDGNASSGEGAEIGKRVPTFAQAAWQFALKAGAA